MWYYQIQIFFLCIAAHVADAAVVNPNGIKERLANGLSTSPIKGKPSFSNSHKIKVYLKILLIVLFYAIEFLINSF